MQTSESGLNETVRVFNALSHGDRAEKIVNDYSGTFGQLKDDANSTVDELQNIIGQIKEVAESIHTAAKESAHGNTFLLHRTEEQAASSEQTAAAGEIKNLIGDSVEKVEDDGSKLVTEAGLTMEDCCSVILADICNIWYNMIQLILPAMVVGKTARIGFRFGRSLSKHNYWITLWQ